MGLNVKVYVDCVLVKATEGAAFTDADIDLIGTKYAADPRKEIFHAFKPGRFDRMDGNLEGLYAGARVPVRAYDGSYGWYNVFRNEVSKALCGAPAETVWEHPERYREQPGYLFVAFSDAEGAIGPLTCAQLGREFAQHAEAFQAAVSAQHLGTLSALGTQRDLLRTYGRFTKAFKVVGESNGFMVYR